MLEPMLKKLTHYQRQAFRKPVYVCAALLDPRLKTMAFSKKTRTTMDMNLADIKGFFIRHATYFELPVDSDIEVLESPPDDDETEGPKLYLGHRGLKTASEEVNNYLGLPRELKGCNLLEYWKTNKNDFPILSRMALGYLAVPATSCPSERAFSAGGHVMSDH